MSLKTFKKFTELFVWILQSESTQIITGKSLSIKAEMRKIQINNVLKVLDVLIV